MHHQVLANFMQCDCDVSIIVYEYCLSHAQVIARGILLVVLLLLLLLLWGGLESRGLTSHLV